MKRREFIAGDRLRSTSLAVSALMESTASPQSAAVIETDIRARPLAPSQHGVARKKSERQQGERRAQAEGEHDDADLPEIAPLRGEKRGSAERRADTGAPDCTQHDADPELARQPAAAKVVEALIGPVCDWTAGNGKPGSKARKHENDADCDDQRGSDIANYVGGESDRKTGGRHE
jgi:hypothetical protein